MVSLKYTLSQKDYVNFYTFVLWDAPGNSKKRFIHYARQLVPILLFLFAFYYTGIFERNSRFILLIIGVIILTTALSLFGVRTNIVKQGNKIADDPGNSSIFLETLLIATETGVSLKDSVKEQKYSWQAFIKKQDNPEYYILFTSSMQGIIIPKRAFSMEEKVRFEKLLTQYLSFDAELGHLVKS